LSSVASTQGFFPYKLFASPEELKETLDSLKNTPTKSEFERKQLDKIAAHLNSDKSANMQLIFIPTSADFDNGIQNQSMLMGGVPQPGSSGGMSLVVLVSYPASRGSVHITSSGELVSERSL
jgi:hypothetical protein